MKRLGGGRGEDDGWRAESVVCLWAADEDGLKGLKLGRCKNKTQGFGLEVKWSRLGIYSARESHMDFMPCYGVWRSPRGSTSPSTDSTCVRVCLVVGGTALVKMTQPIWGP